MSTGAKTPEIAIDDFARRFSQRSDKLMWFLGAGASAAAGVPTASDMVWEFKKLLYVTQRGVQPSVVADLTNPAVRDRLQAYIASAKRFPELGAPQEYADLFEAAFPAESDRRTYLDGKLKGAKPSYGHLALATLMRARKTRMVWMTNFDVLVADACAKAFGSTGHLSTATLDVAEQATSLITGERWPIEFKLHGDFRSSRLKNTNDELRQQDARLRNALVDSCRRYGLVVVGYSGRDASIMDALSEALNHSGAFPMGLFWLHRGDGPPLERVHQLLSRAVESGVDAALVRVENFDEAMRDLVRVVPELDTKELDAFAAERQRWSGARPPSGKTGFPVVRLNALPVTLMPTICRRILCEIGGHAEVTAAVEAAGVHAIVGRVKSGILAYGTDRDLRTAFDKYSIKEFDLYTIDMKRLRYDSGERGLLRQALTQALCKARGLCAVRRRNTDLLTPADPLDVRWDRLKQLVTKLEGTIDHHAELKWHEGVGTRLDWADDRLWLLVEPRIVFEGITHDNRAVATDFARERTVKRYNSNLNDLIDFWAHTLADAGGDLHALGITDGVEATFRLSSTTGFSRRAYA